MRYAVLDTDYIVENIIEATDELADTILCVPIESSDVCIGDIYDIEALWFKTPEGCECSKNEALNNIDIVVQQNIRAKYSETDEFKVLRMAILDPQVEAFTTYNAFIEECRSQGRTLKQNILQGYYKHLLATELEAMQ